MNSSLNRPQKDSSRDIALDIMGDGECERLARDLISAALQCTQKRYKMDREDLLRASKQLPENEILAELVSMFWWAIDKKKTKYFR